VSRSSFLVLTTYDIYLRSPVAQDRPFLAQVEFEVSVLGTEAMIAVSSSEGTGSSTTATAVGNGSWMIEEPVLWGSGWEATADPFTTLSQKRSLIIAADGMSAKYQDMGADTTALQAPMDDEEGTSSAVAKSI
jgi:hypothetical protein